MEAQEAHFKVVIDCHLSEFQSRIKANPLIPKSVTNPLIQGNDVITLGSYENDVIMRNTPGNSRRMRSTKIISNLTFIGRTRR